jgi:low temperature requirement protein LtrA
MGVAGFAVAAAIWWRYFGHVRSDALTLSARAAFLWGYGHLFVYAGIAAVGVGVQLAIESVAPDGDAEAGTGATLVLTAGAATLLAALSFIAWTTADTRDAGVRVRVAATAGLVVLGAIVLALALPAAVMVGGVLVTIGTVTAWQERRTVQLERAPA